MLDKAKLRAFIRTLSDEEISSQVSDLFAFMEKYKQLLLEEQNIRRCSFAQEDFDTQPAYRDIPPAAATENTVEDYTETTLDFEVLYAIQSKVAEFSEDELLENMKKLDELLSTGLQAVPTETFEEYRVAREECGIRYVEDYQCEPIICKNCGAYLLPKQNFCRKCGSPISQGGK